SVVRHPRGWPAGTEATCCSARHPPSSELRSAAMTATRRLGVAAALVDGAVVAGDVEVDGEADTVVAVGRSPAGATGLAVPGFVDPQFNGFGGVPFTAPDVDLDGYRHAASVMATTGVTSFLLTIPTVAPDTYAALLPRAAEACAADLGGARALGVH